MKWEYRVELLLDDNPDPKGPPDKELNELGAEGWELVSVVEVAVHGGHNLRFYFKRPIPE